METYRFIPPELFHAGVSQPSRGRNLLRRVRSLAPNIERETDRLLNNYLYPKKDPYVLTVGECSVRLGIYHRIDEYRAKRELGEEGDFALSMIRLMGSEDCYNKLFIDVGAGIGLYSLFALRSGMVVTSFEPDETNFKSFQRNLRLNDITTCVQANKVALSNKVGYDYLFTDGELGNVPSLKRTRGQRSSSQVLTTTLDTLNREGGFVAPGIIKIDVEGAEMRVLQGGVDFLMGPNRPKHMFVEIHPKDLLKFGTTAELVWNYILGLGYKPVSVYVRNNQLLCQFVVDEGAAIPIDLSWLGGGA